MLSNKNLVHQLFYLALLEIREEAYETKNAKIFHLADLFHNIPLSLNQAEQAEKYDEIMERLTNRAGEKGCEQWLEHQIKNNIQ